ncbi:MAG: hypothetical protein AAB451_03910 [Patescibacteria group bacterium]
MVVDVVVFILLVLIGIKPLIFPTKSTRESLRQADEEWALKFKKPKAQMR